MKHQATFVAPSPAPPAGAVWMDDKPVETMHGVRAQVAQNLCAGVGAATVIAAAWVALFQLLGWAPDAARVATWATLGGALLFGVLMVARNALDEAVGAWDVAMMMRDLSEKDAEIVNLKSLLKAETTRANTAETQANVAALNATGNRAKRVEPAPERAQVWRDAEWLIARRFDTGRWGRDSLVDAGWTPTRWTATMDTLTRAGLTVQKGRAYEPAYQTVGDMLIRLHGYEDTASKHLRGVAASSDEATTDSEATNESSWGRGGE